MLERREGLADSSKQHTQEIQKIRPHVSARPTDQSIQVGYLSHLDFHHGIRNHKTITPSSVD
jgi:hypothetical protein